MILSHSKLTIQRVRLQQPIKRKNRDNLHGTYSVCSVTVANQEGKSDNLYGTYSVCSVTAANQDEESDDPDDADYHPIEDADWKKVRTKNTPQKSKK